MTPRHFVKVTDLTSEEIRWVLEEAKRMKSHPAGDLLEGKTVAMIFSKPSTRTRVSFSVGVHQLGGMPLFLGEHELQMRTSETIEDTARVLSCYVDAIVIRTFAQQDVEDLAANSTVPVINALTDDHHPCQALADIFTFEEVFPDARGRTITYLGDGNNVAASLSAAAALTGIDVCLATPEGYDLPAAVWDEVQRVAAAHGTRVWLERDPAAAAANASALYTDVWISMARAPTPRRWRRSLPTASTTTCSRRPGPRRWSCTVCRHIGAWRSRTPSWTVRGPWFSIRPRTGCTLRRPCSHSYSGASGGEQAATPKSHERCDPARPGRHSAGVGAGPPGPRMRRDAGHR